MNITVIGASAGIGCETVKRAIERNHHVTALSSSATKWTENTQLRHIKGSALHKTNLQQSMANADAVIVALGTGKSIGPTTLYSDFAVLLTAIHEENCIRIPLIMVTSFGTGKIRTSNSFLMKLFFKFFLQNVQADKTMMEEVISQSSMNWTIVRAGVLKNGPLTGKYRAEAILYKDIHTGNINRADLADFLVKEAEQQMYLHQYISLSNK